MIQGGRRSRQIRLFVIATGLLVLGFFVTRDLGRRAFNQQLAAINANNLAVSELFNERLAKNGDPSRLLGLGYRLAVRGQCALAQPALTRAQELMPEYRDTNLLLGWCALKELATEDRSAPSSEKLAAVENALKTAHLIDPLDPLGQELATLVSQISPVNKERTP